MRDRIAYMCVSPVVRLFFAINNWTTNHFSLQFDWYKKIAL